MPPKKSPAKKSPKAAKKSPKASPKSSAKSASKPTPMSNNTSRAQSPTHSSSSSGKRKRPKKGPNEEKSKAILSLRDELIAQGKDAEQVGQACMGMYRCDKQKDEKCLDGIMSKLNTIKMGGGRRKVK